MEALDLRVSFDEKATLERNVNYLVRSLDVSVTLCECLGVLYYGHCVCLFQELFYLVVVEGVMGEECIRLN